MPVLLGSIQVVPFVGDTRQAKMRFGGNRPRRITCQLQDAPVGPCRQRQLVVCFLYLAQTECRRDGVDGIRKRLTDRYDFGIGPAGRGTVALELMGIAQRVGRGSADRQVVRVQILQGAARLGNDGFCIVLNDGQRGPYGGNPSDKVPGPVIWFAACKGCFSSLEFLFDGGMSAAKNSAVAYVTHNEGLASSTVVGSDSSHFRTGAPAPRNCRGTPALQ